MTTQQVHRHGVIVVHGQGADSKAGDFLAQVTNSIADVLEGERGEVARTFSLGGDLPAATIEATPPDTLGDRHRFEFVEAFWDDAFPPPSEQVIYRWAISKGLEQLRFTVRGWLQWPPSPLRVMTRDPVNHLRGAIAPAPGEDKLPVPRLITATYWIQLVAIRLLLAIAFVLGIPILVILFLLDVLDGTPFIRMFGFWSKVSEAIHSLDPFLTKVMGDSERYVEDGMWSASARGVVEGAIIGMLGREDIDDVTIVAHSAGCGVSYDALLEGGRVAEAGLSGKRLTLVTLGSAINRYYWLSKARHAVSPFAQRFATRGLDPRVTGVVSFGPDGISAPASAPEAEQRARFRWLDIYARFDYVPAGPVRPEVLRAARLDDGQFSSRQVINTDGPGGDHFAYFRNKSLVIPRINRAICGGVDPWPPVVEGGDSWTKAKARRHLVRVAVLQTVRLTAIGLAIVHLALLGAWSGYRHARPAEWLLERIADGISRIADRLPLLHSFWDTDVKVTLGRLVAVLGPIIILLAIERMVHSAWFSDI
jgi:hypothetical protein